MVLTSQLPSLTLHRPFATPTTLILHKRFEHFYTMPGIQTTLMLAVLFALPLLEISALPIAVNTRGVTILQARANSTFSRCPSLIKEVTMLTLELATGFELPICSVRLKQRSHCVSASNYKTCKELENGTWGWGVEERCHEHT